nr:MAG TPA: hypothetical protein [Caudoviricetes sp.]
MKIDLAKISMIFPILIFTIVCVMLFEYQVTLLMRFYQISKEKSIFSLKIEF